jgi:ATP-binding cassette subfamily C protein LapB
MENSKTINVDVKPAIPEKEGFSDPLLDCLVVLSRLYEHPISANALIAGLPLVKNRLTPQLFMRAAERIGLVTKLVQRPLTLISKLILPAVLILKNNNACILTKTCDGDKNCLEIIMPDSGGGVAKVSLEDLKDDYTGFAIFLKPVLQFEKRADEFNVASNKSWFWGTLWEYRGIYAQVIAAALFINIFSLASPLFVMNVYNRVVPNFAEATLWVLALGMSFVIGFDLLVRTLRGYLIDIAGKKADVLMASKLFQQTLNIKMSAKPASAGAFANNLKEFEVLRDFFTSATVSTLVDLPFVFIFVIVMFIIGGSVAFVPLFAIPIILLGSYFLEIPIQKAVESAMFAATQKHAILVETVSGLETIKATGAEGSLLRKWEQYVGTAAQAGLKSRLFSGFAVNFTNFIAQFVTVGIIIVGVYLAAQQKMTLGGLIACMILVGRVIAPLSQIAALLTRFNQSRIALKGLNKLMELPVERPQEKKFLHKPLFKENIEFHNVSLQYPNQEHYALKDLNFKINIGEHVAIIGRMGSGKSSLQKLILNLYSPTEGAIFIDGIDSAQIDPADLRRNIGYVSQDYSLLYGTVYENIALGTPWASDQMVLQAAKMVGIDSFIQQHPAGFAMPIGEQGGGLSGGQRQAIAIARAILAGPSVLLLDEPTSSIDEHSEKIIVDNLRTYLEGRTLILVTHKAALLGLVDRLIVLDNGKIIADGEKNSVLRDLQHPQMGAHIK